MTEFEKELVRFVSGYLDAGVSAEDYVKAFSQRLLDSIGRQSKPKVSERLYDFMKKRSESLYFHDDFEIAAYKKGVVDGAKWQKDQFMKEAVEVVVWDAGVDFAPHPVISVEDFNVKDGDKVRIIIVKED